MNLFCDIVAKVVIDRHIRAKCSSKNSLPGPFLRRSRLAPVIPFCTELSQRKSTTTHEEIKNRNGIDLSLVAQTSRDL